MKVITMGQGSAERYEPARTTVCISITTPGAPMAELHDGFADVLRLSFVDYQWEKWRECETFMTPRQARAVVDFAQRNADAPMCVIHCTVGASRSVSMAMALEAAGLADYLKPPWWGELKGENDPATGWIPNPGVYELITEAARSAASHPLRPLSGPREQRGNW